MKLVFCVTLILAIFNLLAIPLSSDFVWPKDACEFVGDGTGLIKTRDHGTCNPDWKYLSYMFLVGSLLYFYICLCLWGLYHRLKRAVVKISAILSAKVIR